MRSRAWLLIAITALAPLWAVGMFGRGYWTPDEPREADITWRMSIQQNHVLPQLAGAPFLEKPPLSYWLSGAAIRVFGDSPQAARLPNLFYALIATISVWLLVSSMAGGAAACASAIIAGTAFTSYQVSVWLAPDACLVAGCAISLLGLFRGYTASSSRSRVLWYTLMHAGALVGFMAKSGPGWIFPGLTLLCLVTWERRWRELIRWELWAGLPLQLLVIGVWVHAVWKMPGGSDALAALFWNNDVGRFVDLHAAGPLNYAAGHPNWPGKYFVSLPYHLFPWSAIVLAALIRAWGAVRMDKVNATPWRIAICASLPFICLLSIATTARGIYIAPALIGFAVAAGLWIDSLTSITTRADVMAIQATRYAAGCVVALVAVALLVMGFALGGSAGAAMAVACVVAALSVTGVAVLALKRSLGEQRGGRPIGSLAWSWVAYAAAITIGAVVLFPQLSRWQDLPGIARAVSHDAQGRALALLLPDETTIAMLDHGLLIRSETIGSDEAHAQEETVRWLHAHPASGVVLVKLPDSPRKNDMLLALERDRDMRIVNRYELPHGRRYALVSNATDAVDREAGGPRTWREPSLPPSADHRAGPG